MAIQIAKNTSRSNKWVCKTKSALERNLNAKANSINPKTTFTVLSHPPDLGKFFIKFGNKANAINGKANPSPKPNMAIDNMVAPPSVDSTLPKTKPNAGPVQENDTIISVNAIKNIPKSPPEFEALSALLAKLAGIVISKAPKKDMANTKKTKKKKIFK